MTATRLLPALLVGLLACNGEAPTDPDDTEDLDVDSGDIDTDEGWTPDENTLIQGDPECPAGSTNSIVPSAEEVGYRAAVRLTPPSWPYQVTALRAVLAHDLGAGCDASMAHTLEAFVSSDLAPPATWAPDASVTLGAEEVDEADGVRIADGLLETPLVLGDGEHLFVAVRIEESDDGRTCTTICSTAEAEADRNYWSNAADGELPWPTMSSFGVNGWFLIVGLGEPAGVDI